MVRHHRAHHRALFNRERISPYCFAQAFTSLLHGPSWVPIVAALLWEPAPRQVAGNSCGKYPRPHATDPRRGFMVCKLVYMATRPRPLARSLALLHPRPIKIRWLEFIRFALCATTRAPGSASRASVNFAELIQRLGASLIHEAYHEITARGECVSRG